MSPSSRKKERKANPENSEEKYILEKETGQNCGNSWFRYSAQKNKEIKKIYCICRGSIFVFFLCSDFYTFSLLYFISHERPSLYSSCNPVNSEKIQMQN
jgi:hypothetical protein